MSRSITTILTLAALSGLATAQAPIERQQNQQVTGSYPQQARHYRSAPRALDPVPGIRVFTAAPLDTVATDADRSEFRLAHGQATVSVDHPTDNALILFDLPNGQADLLKDGLYSLNAENNTLTVVRGEADVFPPNAPPDAKGTTVREGETIALGANARPREANRAELGTTQIPGASPDHYGEGYVAEPGWDAYPVYDYGWDYPYYGYGWGYPYVGFGYGWGGGWGWGRGFRGGYGGFHGGGFHHR